ncbi:MAG: DUF327 family protein [Synergistaceae bacterium]|jgi:uncharacterized protein YaaR (DUF327 family)|nr:DUF327 family protein [Synergistaceae bacterium]
MKVKRGEGKVEEGSGGTARRHSESQGVVAARPPFGVAMNNAMEELEVRELLGRLDALVVQLSIFPAERLLLEYRTILKELLTRTMRGFTLRRDLQWRRTSRSTYITVEKVESSLNELEEAFQQEGGRIRALRLMEEIKGCLISLLF